MKEIININALLPVASDRVYSENEVAAITTLSVKTLQRDRFHRKGLPYIKMTRRVGYLGRDILDYIENSRIAPAA